MRIFQLNIYRELHINGLCDWCGLPSEPGHICPVDDDEPPEEITDDELAELLGEGA